MPPKVVTITGEVNLFTDERSVHEIDIPDGYVAVCVPREGLVFQFPYKPGNYRVSGEDTIPFPYAVVVTAEESARDWLLVPQSIRDSMFAELLDPEFAAHTGHDKFDA